MNKARLLPVIVLVGLLRLAGDCRASTPPEFLNIEWGASPAAAKFTMAPHEGVSIKEEVPARIVFRGGTFATHPAERWVLEFPDGKFSRGTVYITIPPGKSADGTLLRNQQFEDYYKTLVHKYGHGRRGGDRDHAQALWMWTASNPRSGVKEQVSILLSYSWNPYEFKVQYASLPRPTGEAATFGKPVNKNDL